MADIRTTTQLTDFTGPNEDPLSDGGNWAGAGVATGGQLARLTNSAVNTAASSLGHSWWVPQTYNDGQVIEVWGDAQGGGGGAGGEGWRIGMFNAAGQGYIGLFFSAGSPFIVIRKYFGGLPGPLTGNIGVGFNGGFFLFRKSPGGVIDFYNSQDGGANWSLLANVTNTEIGTGGAGSSDFHLVLGAEDQGFGQICSWNSMGGGNPLRRRPQIYRWVTN